VEFESMPSSASFGSALDQSVNLIDRLMLFLETTGISQLSGNGLDNIDSNILQAQQATNKLQKYVMMEFAFMRNPAD
jgi:hypothetical protein